MADGPLSDSILERLTGRVVLLPWNADTGVTDPSVAGLFTYGHPVVDGALLDRFPAVKVISNFGVGVDHVHLADAAARGVRVGHTPGILDRAVADMAFALLLAAARGVVQGDRYARSPRMTRYDPSYLMGCEVHGSTLGIVGMGRIGAEVARRAKAFQLAVLYHNRARRESLESALGARYVQLDQLLAESDYVVLTVSLTDQTRGLIGRAELARMKRTAVLINISRGAVVDTQALTEALEQRRIHAAALDVTEPEPLARDHPLLSLDNLVITPHLGSATRQTRERMADVSVRNLLNGLAGRPLVHEAVLASSWTGEDLR